MQGKNSAKHEGFVEYLEQDLLLQIGVAEVQKDMLSELDESTDIVKLVEQKKSALKDALINYLEGDMILFKIYLNHGLQLDDELKVMID